jgi:hypothetical protein
MRRLRAAPAHAGEDPVAHLRALAARLGLDMRRLVALAGAHPLARWWPDAQPPYYPRHCHVPPPRFSNAYFKSAAARYREVLCVYGRLAGMSKLWAMLVSETSIECGICSTKPACGGRS